MVAMAQKEVSNFVKQMIRNELKIFSLKKEKSELKKQKIL